VIIWDRNLDVFKLREAKILDVRPARDSVAVSGEGV
jgi:hypothetical protein